MFKFNKDTRNPSHNRTASINLSYSPFIAISVPEIILDKLHDFFEVCVKKRFYISDCLTQSAITCSKATKETLEQGVNYV